MGGRVYHLVGKTIPHVVCNEQCFVKAGNMSGMLAMQWGGGGHEDPHKKPVLICDGKIKWPDFGCTRVEP